jgi:hypothetical protein
MKGEERRIACFGMVMGVFLRKKRKGRAGIG